MVSMGIAKAKHAIQAVELLLPHIYCLRDIPASDGQRSRSSPT